MTIIGAIYRCAFVIRAGSSLSMVMLFALPASRLDLQFCLTAGHCTAFSQQARESKYERDQSRVFGAMREQL